MARCKDSSRNILWQEKKVSAPLMSEVALQSHMPILQFGNFGDPHVGMKWAVGRLQ